MDVCPKCGGKELAIDSVDYITVYGVIGEDEDFQEESHKFFDREQMRGGETRCVACGYSTANENWPNLDKADPDDDDDLCKEGYTCPHCAGLGGAHYRDCQEAGGS